MSGGFDAGRITAVATLDKTPFMRSITEIRAEAKKLQRERFDAKVGADTRDGDAKLLAFQRKLGGVGGGTTTARVSADTTAANLKLKPLQDRLAELRNRVSTARVGLKGNDRALLQLDALKISLDAVDKRIARPRISLAGADAAEISLDRLALKLRSVGVMHSAAGGGSGGRGFFGTLGGLGDRAPRASLRNVGLALSPAAIPLAGAGLGLGAGLLTPTVAGGLGGGLFAKTAAATYKTLQADIKTTTALQMAYNNAATSKTRAAAEAKQKAFWASLSPEQVKAINNVHSFSIEWQAFQHKLEPQTFRLFATGSDIGTKALKLLLPVTRSAGNAIDGLAASADHALSQPFWKDFFTNFLPGEAHRSLTTLGTDLGQGITGIAHLMEQFAPLGHRLEADSTRWAKQFNAWTQGEGPGRFVNWVEKEGPVAASALKGLAHGVEGLVKGFAPIGQIELKALTPVLNAIGDLGNDHPKIIAALGASLLTVGAGLKAIEAARGAAAVIKTIRGLGGGGPGIALGSPLRRGSSAVRTAEGAAVASGAQYGPELAGLGAGAEAGAGAAAIAGLSTGAALVPILGTLAATVGALYVLEKGKPTGTPDANRKKENALSGQVGPGGGRNLFNPAGIAATGAGYTETQLSAMSSGQLLTTLQNVQKYGSSAQLAGLVSRMKQIAGSTPAAVDALSKFGVAVNATASPVATLISHLGAGRKESKALGDSFVNLDATVQKYGSPALKGASTAAIANRAALAGAAAEVKGYGDRLVANSTPAKQAAAQTAALAKKFEIMATGVYGSKSQVDQLLKSLGLLPHQVRTKILVEGRKELDAVEAQINRLHSKTINIAISRHGLSNGRAAGGYIAGPGTGTSDSIPAMLSNGEFVVNANATSRHRQLLHAINSNRFAAGGPVSSATGSTASKGPSHLTIANAIASLVNFGGTTFLADLQGTAKQVRSGIGQMITRLNSAVRNDYLAGDTALVNVLQNARKPLARLAAEIDDNAKALSSAQQRLATLRGNAAGVRSGTVSSFLGLGDLTQASNTTTVGGLVDVLGQQKKVGRAFDRNLATLRKRGLSKAEYRILEQAGPAAAGGIVGLLSTATRGQLKTINGDVADLRSLGAHSGAASADYLYGARISASRSEVSDLRHDRSLMLREQKRAGDALETIVKDGLRDKGTHAALATLHDDLGHVKTLLAHLAGAPHQARTNQRAHVKGVNR